MWRKAKASYTTSFRDGTHAANQYFPNLRFLEPYLTPIVIHPLEAWHMLQDREEVLHRTHIVLIRTYQHQQVLMHRLRQEWFHKVVAESGLQHTLRLLNQQRRDIALLESHLGAARKCVGHLAKARQQDLINKRHNQTVMSSTMNKIIEAMRDCMINLR